MKILKYSLIVAAFGAAMGLSSCSDKADYVQAPNDVAGYSFLQGSLNDTAPLNETVEYEITVVRNTDKGDVTLPVSVVASSNTDYTVDGVTCSNAVFANGSYTATVTLRCPGAMPPTIYSGTLEFDKEQVSYSGISACSFYIPINYEWEDMDGTGWFFEDFIYVGWYECKFQKAVGFNRWRVLEPFTEFYEDLNDWGYAGNIWGWGWYYNVSEAPAYIEFYEEDGGWLSFEPFNAGYTTGDSNYVYYLPGGYAGYFGSQNTYVDYVGWWGYSGNIYNIWRLPGWATFSPNILPDGQYWYYCYSEGYNRIFDIVLPGYDYDLENDYYD